MPFTQLMKIVNMPHPRRYSRSGEPPNFCKKGAGKDDKPTKQIKHILNKERSTRLEGSFGNEKEHYLLHKIKARSPKNEEVWAGRRCDILWRSHSQCSFNCSTTAKKSSTG